MRRTIFSDTIYALLIILFLSVCAFATEPDSTATGISRWRGRFSTGLTGAYVLPSCQIARGDNAFDKKITASYGLDMQYAFMMRRGTKADRLYPYTYQGAGVSVTGFSSNVMTRTPVNIYVLQGSRIASLTPSLSLDYEWNFGASLGWRKISGENPFDKSDVEGFGSNANAYINLGFMLRQRLSDKLVLSAGIGMTHYSNGNTDYPNPGINALWGRVGLSYFPGSITAPSRKDWSFFEAGFVYDVTLYGAWTKCAFDTSPLTDDDEDMRMAPGHFAVAGFNINPLYRFNPVIAAGLSLDAQYTEGANLTGNYIDTTPVDDPLFYRTSFADRSMIGISARAELTMPVFSVNIGVGHSIWAPGGHDLRGWYQTFTLKTFVSRGLYISTGYRLVRFHLPGNLMLGIGYSFGR